MLPILLNKIPYMIIRKERIWQIQPWNIWEKQVQSGAKEVFLPPWWILDSNGISPMLGHLYNTFWLQVCTLLIINDVSGKDLFESAVLPIPKKVMSINIWNETDCNLIWGIFPRHLLPRKTLQSHIIPVTFCDMIDGL